MEYFVGSLTTLLVFWFVNNKIKTIESKNKIVSVKYSQSNTYELIKPIIPFIYKYKQLNTQASKFDRSHKVRILVMEDSAYWIVNNQVFVAPVLEDGQVDSESATPIDTMGMDKIQLDKMIFIIDKLTEGNSDDRSNTGN